MSRQHNQTRGRKLEDNKRDAASSGERYARNERESRQDSQPRRDDTERLVGFNRYRLNDLYERSSL